MSEKVLLVDDEEEFTELLAERMRARGMQVETCGSAAEALEKTEKSTYDAIVLDLMMPGIDGIEALKRIKASSPELQIILLTGHASLEKGIEAIKMGAVDFLEKPADLEVLTQKIRKAKAKKMVIVEKQTEEKINRIMTEKGW